MVEPVAGERGHSLVILGLEHMIVSDVFYQPFTFWFSDKGFCFLALLISGIIGIYLTPSSIFNICGGLEASYER